MTGNIAASVLARLLALAKHSGEDYSLLLNRFATERFLARLGRSPHANRFLLKGALLFALWYDTPHRPTRDADLLGFGPADEATLIATFRDIAAMDLGDGVLFHPTSLKAAAIREDQTYGGTRLHLSGRIGSARCVLQIDVGFGDAVTPAAERLTYPALLKDFFDLAVIARRTALEGTTLASAIAATFSRRQTPLPATRPLALTEAFSDNPAKQRQWQAFLGKNGLATTSLGETIALLDHLLWPPTLVAVASSGATATWHPDTARWA